MNGLITLELGRKVAGCRRSDYRARLAVVVRSAKPGNGHHRGIDMSRDGGRVLDKERKSPE